MTPMIARLRRTVEIFARNPRAGRVAASRHATRIDQAGSGGRPGDTVACLGRKRIGPDVV
jgi:hypothetical protein